jgi:hypothetical protein
MKLSQLAAKPQLIEVILDDEETIAKYGEAVSFMIWDRQNMNTFIKLATLNYEDFGSIAELMNDLVLDDEGKPIVNEDLVLPTDLLMKAIVKVIDTLGKSVTPLTEMKTENSK